MLRDYYNTGDDAILGAYGSSWIAQTFLTTAAYSITSVKILAYRIGTVSTLTLSIRATSGGEPTGGDLVSGTLDISTLTTSSSGEWIEVVLASPYSLSGATQYAIVCRTNGTSTSNRMFWKRDSSSPTYTDGLAAFSSNSGSTWDITSFAGSDLMFETYDTQVNHEISGACAISFSKSGDLTGLFLLSGSSPIGMTLSGVLSADVLISGTSGLTLGLTASRLFKLFKVDHTVPLRRLVAAGNNKIYYEIL